MEIQIIKLQTCTFPIRQICSVSTKVLILHFSVQCILHVTSVSTEFMCASSSGSHVCVCGQCHNRNTTM